MKKLKVFNLIILDATGSMSMIADATISALNTTIETIKSSAEDLKSTQEQFLSLILFNSKETKILFDKVPITEVNTILRKDYCPMHGTPLYDAIGSAVETLSDYVSKFKMKAVDVTIITDGLENSSKTWTHASVEKLIEDKKKEGWNFSFEGTEGLDEEAASLGFSNVFIYDHTATGIQGCVGTLNMAKTAYYNSANTAYKENANNPVTFTTSMCKVSSDYFKDVDNKENQTE